MRKDAPIVDIVVGGVNVPFTYRWTRDVLPTPIRCISHSFLMSSEAGDSLPCDPSTQILASRLLDMIISLDYIYPVRI